MENMVILVSMMDLNTGTQRDLNLENLAEWDLDDPEMVASFIKEVKQKLQELKDKAE